MKTNHWEERRKFVSEAFHTLNQPLTGLHCGLEIALQRPRSEGEYRKRIGDGLENAGNILELIRAVRQLVDAGDPGERFGTVSLAMVLSQLKNELEVVAETTGVALEVECAGEAQVKADPGRLATCLGALTASEMEGHEAGGQVRLEAVSGKKQVSLRIVGAGPKKAKTVDGKTAKLAEIRRHAGLSYVWAIGGNFEVMPAGLKISLISAR